MTNPNSPGVPVSQFKKIYWHAEWPARMGVHEGRRLEEGRIKVAPELLTY